LRESWLLLLASALGTAGWAWRRRAAGAFA